MKIGMISLGCPKNLVDSEVMLGLAQQARHLLTRDAAEAEVLVVNTCAFIDKAKQESIDAILEMAEHKKQGRCRTLVVAGCMAERYRAELLEQIPEIDAVIGTGEIPEIVNVLRSRDSRLGTGDSGLGARGSGLGIRTVPLLRSNGEQIDTNGYGPAANAAQSPGLPTYIYDADTPRLLATPRHYAYLKIAEGCDYKCAFCIIPTLRGHYRSRTPQSILQEARALAANGVKELLLISQDTSFYGVDRGERGALAGLLRALNTVDGLEWIRMLYLYPTTIGDDVLEAMAESDKVCKYIDLPLQHASDSVLKRMKRPGTRSSYQRLLGRIRTRMPAVTLRTTFIVGFPGETEDDFAELQGFVDEMRFDHLGVFTYSHEEGTSARDLPDDVPAQVKRRRQSRLMSEQKRHVTRAQAARVGQRVRLLVDGPSDEQELVLRGRLESQAPDIDSLVYLTDCDVEHIATGSFLEAEVVGSNGYDLVARPLSPAA
jgi:ribosomal protein S12 methylthiotransferase